MIYTYISTIGELNRLRAVVVGKIEKSFCFIHPLGWYSTACPQDALRSPNSDTCARVIWVDRLSSEMHAIKCTSECITKATTASDGNFGLHTEMNDVTVITIIGHSSEIVPSNRSHLVKTSVWILLKLLVSRFYKLFPCAEQTILFKANTQQTRLLTLKEKNYFISHQSVGALWALRVRSSWIWIVNNWLDFSFLNQLTKSPALRNMSHLFL